MSDNNEFQVVVSGGRILYTSGVDDVESLWATIKAERSLYYAVEPADEPNFNMILNPAHVILVSEVPNNDR